MADVRHGNFDAGRKSCARVAGVKQQSVASVNGRSERLPPPGSMSSSPASLDADVNSLSTTSSTTSSCLPLVPTSSRSVAAATPSVSGKSAAPCGQSRGTSNVRPCASGPGSIITYIDCNNTRRNHKHQPFSPIRPDHDDDDEEEADDEADVTVVQLKSKSTTSSSHLQVRRGSEPVLTALHRLEDNLTAAASSDNSKRWSTAIAVDSSGRQQSCSRRSSESVVSVIVTHSFPSPL